MGRTPEEIKKGLECVAKQKFPNAYCECSYLKHPARNLWECPQFEIVNDALAYIQQLEQINADFTERTAQLEARRDELELFCAKESTREAESDLIYLKAINDIVQKIPRWFSAKDSPPKRGRYLVITQKGDGMTKVHTATYNDMGWWTYANFGEITHWMLLPEPPKED